MSHLNLSCSFEFLDEIVKINLKRKASLILPFKRINQNVMATNDFYVQGYHHNTISHKKTENC